MDFNLAGRAAVVAGGSKGIGFVVVRQLPAVMLVASSIVRFGTEEQRRTFLPKIASGDLRFCLGYEPVPCSDLAGISVSPHTSLAGDVCWTVYYDNVGDPDSALVGQVNDGWRVITHALAGERVVMCGIAVDCSSKSTPGREDKWDHHRLDPLRIR